MEKRDLYFHNLLRKYGEGHYEPHNTPQAPRMTSHKKALLQKGIPLQLENGTVTTTDRGDLVFISLKGEKSQFINVPDSKLI